MGYFSYTVHAEGRPAHRHPDPQRRHGHLRRQPADHHRPGERERPEPGRSTRPSKTSTRSTPAPRPAAWPPCRPSGPPASLSAGPARTTRAAPASPAMTSTFPTTAAPSRSGSPTRRRPRPPTRSERPHLRLLQRGHRQRRQYAASAGGRAGHDASRCHPPGQHGCPTATVLARQFHRQPGRAATTPAAPASSPTTSSSRPTAALHAVPDRHHDHLGHLHRNVRPHLRLLQPGDRRRRATCRRPRPPRRRPR